MIPGVRGSVNMVKCDDCKKYPAIVFISSMHGSTPHRNGLCLLCAKKAEIPQVAEYIKHMGITDEDIERSMHFSSMSEAVDFFHSKQRRNENVKIGNENVKIVNMVLCRNCKRRPSIVFITSMCGSEKQRHGLCLSCAKKEEIPQVAEYIGYMGITDEDIEHMYGSGLNDENSELGNVSSMPDSIRSMFTDHP